MSLPGNGIFVLRGEISTLMTAIKRGARWNSSNYQEEEQDGLMKQFSELKNLLINIEDLRLIEPKIFLGPFLEVIRSEETTGQITSLALSALNKFLSYGLIDPTHSTIATTADSIADAVTHARFVGSDQASDGVVLMKVVQVLRTLILNPEGSALTDESVCEVMLSCIRIVFEPRLNELLRRTAEQVLKDIVLLLFMRLPQFAEERHTGLIRKLKMMSSGGGMETSGKRRRSTKSLTKTNTLQHSSKPISNATKNMLTTPAIRCTEASEANTPKASITVDNATVTPNQALLSVQKSILATTPSTPLVGNIVDMQGKFMQTPHPDGDDKCDPSTLSDSKSDNNDGASNSNSVDGTIDENAENDADVEDEPTINNENSAQPSIVIENKEENASTSLDANPIVKESMSGATLTPYGLPLIHELLRFLISLVNPLDKQNSDVMIHMGLSLLTIALEVGADSIGKYDSLLEMVKDDLCRNLFALLSTERLTIFAADLQVCFLLFESQRSWLKFHLEYYLNKLAEIIGSENPRTPYEIRELALDNLLQFLRIPSFAAELYINYDCNLYCTNLLEDLVKLLSKNSLSATQAIYTIHDLSLDGLMTIVGDIEKNCSKQVVKNSSSVTVGIVGGHHSRNNSTTDKITLDHNNSSDVMVTTSGGEESGAIESIHSFMNKKKPSNANIDTIDEGLAAHETQNKFDVITHDQLIEVKDRKRILTQGTELFNQRPDKGIQFLQENGYLKPELDPAEVAHFLRDNSSLDKKMIGEYISKKKNVESKILENFVKSFNFENMRIDLALRQYLETFRLPGEAPLIFLVLEHFADHWHKMNGEPFTNTDAAFSLAYAIIMLNMDQHNTNAKRLNIPMSADDFTKNLRGVNGKGDFDQDMLKGIFDSIKNEEIIMPAEQTGLVRENYLWKVLLRRNKTKDGRYLRVNGASLDKDIFQLVWGPTLAALSFMFDRSSVESTYHKSLVAFTKGAAISSHFMLHDDFNALILTLCKFTTLLNNLNASSTDAGLAHVANPSVNTTNEISTSVQFGLNVKAQLAMKGVFAMVHKHGDCLRCDGWKNVIEVILQLFKLKLLPKILMEVEDFCEPSGKVTLILEKPLQKQEVGLFSSIYMYLASDGQRQPTYEEQEIIKVVRKCVRECQLDQIIGESKFLHVDALKQLIQCLLNWLKPPSVPKAENISYAEDTTVFLLEFLVKILIQNRDRLLPLWSDCRDQIYLLLLGSSSYGYNYLLLRTTVGLLKLAIYLMRNEDLCPVVLQSLKMFLLLNPNIILKISKQISTGLYELLKTSAQNIHTESDWDIIFTLLECVGAGAIPADYEESLTLTQAYLGAKSEGALSSGEEESASAAIAQARGYISDPEISTRLHTDTTAAAAKTPTQENWIIVNNKDSDVTVTSRPNSPIHSLVYPCKLMRHSTFALVKCWDSLAFIVRNVAHITPYNFESCVKCIRTFVEASINGGNLNPNASVNRKPHHNRNPSRKVSHKRREQLQANNGGVANASAPSAEYPLLHDSDDENEDGELLQRYETISIQLLDLMHTLHTRTAQIFRWWAEENGSLPQGSRLWSIGWCPILQGIARLATDQRKQVRTSAVTWLQRSLLVHDLHTLTGPEWESCFKQVLFPLLYDLLTEVPTVNITGNVLEESRMRTATIMSKVFLHHLTPLITLASFSELWLDILDYIEKFMRVGSDMLHEAMLESLKNMLLVMHSVRVFHNNDGVTHSPLWELTWKRVNQFLPNLKEELFDKEPMLSNRGQMESAPRSQVVSPSSPPLVQNVHSIPSISSPNQLQSLINPNQLVNSALQQQQQFQQPQQQELQHHQQQQQQQQATSQQQPLSAQSIPISSIILEPPQNTFVHPSISLVSGVEAQAQPQIVPQQLEHQNMSQIQQPLIPSFVPHVVPAPVEVQSTMEPPVTVSPAHSQPTLIEQTIPSDQIAAAIQSNLPVASTPESNELYANFNTYCDKSPCINPNFSKIIDLPVTPSPPPITEEPSENSIDELASSPSKTNDQSPAHIEKPFESQEPKVPLSHLIATNQYPSLNRIPPANIVQSFAPVYNQQHSNQQSYAACNENEDLYSSYVNNPYNLTLHVEQSFSNTSPTTTNQLSSEQSSVTATASNLNVFQSVNYFGAASDAPIPPGSEMLFGSP
ncbi:Golgi-specific brefeldin A-resistance guanine nucleotide exchange factor 1 isoform X3 [Sitodiplosis mosellana]|uniref:Golgi-specific brefeldin A-resistance guanine nucleotide exchange factor 1 isoform X3 n=1 Tax=Sitodiplosis mosellana TaxID=263140 RepID=UPI002444FAC5|nr:Golgi-specific brefeldin A-resistance guanine nucleotide exchange factor 1 isoform X3 [Sitodiplosis mosellana]